jgi:hypothetical protein
MFEDTYDQENIYHDELERDWDEPYTPEDARYDDWYDEQYEVEDF